MPPASTKPGWISVELLAVIVTLSIQTGGFVWFAAKLDARVGYLEQFKLERDKQVAKIEDKLSDSGTRVTTLEVQTRTIVDTTARIERKLDQALERDNLTRPHP